jgi:hypothetical protein
MVRPTSWDFHPSGDLPQAEPWLPFSVSSLSIPIAGNEDEFKQRARLIAYQQLLHRMFGSSFECVPISDGFSGSSVVKITPFDALGNREESVIVKLDSAQNVRTEVAHSIQARAAIGDIAARVLGEPIFIVSDIDGMEYGGFKVELAGAVLQVPELSARGADSPMINTFKDLVVFECEEAVLSRLAKPALDSSRPYGSIFSIIKELFGLDGCATRSLRRFEAGSSDSTRRRFSKSDPNHPSGGDFLASRLPGDIVESEPVLSTLDVFRRIGGRPDIPNPYTRINEALQRAKKALSQAPKEWHLVRGFSHGDLNGSNIIIDAMEGMWLIDFATAKKLPLTADLAKLETCILFEYCFVPIPLAFFLELVREVEISLPATWLRISVEALQSFLDLYTQSEDMETALSLMEDKSAARRLQARLTDGADVFWETLNVLMTEIVPWLLPCAENVFSGAGKRGLEPSGPNLSAWTLALQVSSKMRLYCLSDIEKLFLSIQEESGVFDWVISPVEFAVMLLRESGRLVRYSDIPPWVKLVVAELGSQLALLIENEIRRLKGEVKRIELSSSYVGSEDGQDETDVFDDAIIQPVNAKKVVEEDASKYLKYVKTKFGYLIDFVSGRQLDVTLQCCDLHLLGSSGPLSLDYITHFPTLFGKEKELPRGVVVQGIPGSGKSYLLRKLLVDSIDNGSIPIFVSVNLGVGTRDTKCWLDAYLRRQFVDDSARLRLLRSALRSQRALLLVDGLDDAGSGETLREIIKCLTAKLNSGIRIVVTCRKKALPQWALDELREVSKLGFLEIAPLDRDQRREVVKSRLADPSLLGRFETFFDSLQSSGMSGELLKSPAFLSMVLCYWTNVTSTASSSVESPVDRQGTISRTLTLIRDQTETLNRSISPVGSVLASGPSVVDVYRVAVSVLVHRYQVVEEADRSRVRESAKRLTDLLRSIAFECKLMHRDSMNSDSSDDPLWLRVTDHVVQGRFSLLTYSVSPEGGIVFKFCLSGILDLLAAEHIIHSDNVSSVCAAMSVDALVSDPWWVPTMAIVAEKAPLKYVRLVERKLTITSTSAAINGSGDTCLHLAARAGHLPFFSIVSKSSLLESLVDRPNTLSLLPLHEAAKSQAPASAEICRLLVAARADVWATTQDGWCALYFAASFHNRDVCAALLEDSRVVRGGGRFSQLPQLPAGQLLTLSQSGLCLASKIIKNELKSASEFIETAKHVFPELSYFRGRSDTTPDASASVTGLNPSEIEYRRTMGAMLSVFWIVGDRYEEFVACQPSDGKLTRASWERIRHWVVSRVKLTSPEALDAMLCLMAIHDLGKLKDFRNDLARDYKDHDAAMRFIMGTTPEVLPSLCRLPDTYQQTVKAALGLDFNFGQFLQAENLPVNLCAIRDLGEATLAFYLFHIFADMAGIMGAQTLEGSAFMTETMYSNFSLGIESLSQLSVKSVEEVYNEFLGKRAVAQQIDPNERELIRLACLSRVFDPVGASAVKEAWLALPGEARDRLGDFLARTGVTGKRPAFILYYAPAFMENCRHNPSIPLVEAMRFLLRILEAAKLEFQDSCKHVIVVHIAEAAELAKRDRFARCLESVCFRIVRSTGARRLSEATVRISPWYRPVSDAISSISFSNEGPLIERIPELTFVKSGPSKSALLLEQLLASSSLAGKWIQSKVSCGRESELALIITALAGLSELRELRTDLGVDGETTVAELVRRFPSVFPSFSGLSAEEKQVVVSVLGFPFTLESVVTGERLSQQEIEVLLRELEGMTLRLFLVYSLVTASCISESFVAVFKYLAELLLETPRRTGDEILRDYLFYRADHQGLAQSLASPRNSMVLSTQERDSVVKLACLVRVYLATGGLVVQTAFNSLSTAQKSTLIEYLSASGERAVINGLSNFLSACKQNSAVGLEAGFIVIARLLGEAHSDTLDVKLLVQRANSHVTPVPFSEILFEVSEKGLVVPELLIPVGINSRAMTVLCQAGSSFTCQAIQGLIPDNLEDMLVKVYPEFEALSLVSSGAAPEELSPDATVGWDSAATVERGRVVKAVQAITYVLSNKYDMFSKGQSGALSITGWLSVREWLSEQVLANPDTLDALLSLLVLTAVKRVARIDPLHDQDRFPSLARLSLKHRSLLKQTLECSFNFGQFLQGESGSHPLIEVQQLVRAHGSFGLQFFLAFNFAQQCALNGINGPVFVNDSVWNIFLTGKEAIGQRPDHESLETMHCKYLLRRGGRTLSAFRENADEFRALCRLVCLSRIASESEARALELAFDDLIDEIRESLTTQLNRPNIVLSYVPSFVENLKINSSVPTGAKLMVLNDLLSAVPTTTVGIVDCSQPATWARDVQMFEYNRKDFRFACDGNRLVVQSSKGLS